MKKLSLKFQNINLAIVGLGYVGLPLAVEFGKNWRVIGFDINEGRVSDLKKLNDSTLEVDQKELKSARYLSFTNNISDKGQHWLIPACWLLLYSRIKINIANENRTRSIYCIDNT